MALVQLMVIALCIAACIASFQLAALFIDGTLYVSRMRICLALWCPALIAKRAYGKKSLDLGGSIAGFFVGFVLMLHSYAHVAAMIVFFVSSSSLTKFRQNVKLKLESNSKEGGQRNWKQVVSNGGASIFFALLALIGKSDVVVLGGERRLRLTKLGGFDRMLWYDLAIFGSIASAAGDTWSSEIGAAVGSGQPRLITNLKAVPRGTNGAISFAGTLASIGGGTVVGLAYWLTIILTTTDRGTIEDRNSLPQWAFVLFGSFCGLAGSVIDSLLGALLQYSGFDPVSQRIVDEPGANVRRITGLALLDNNSVNLLTSLISSLLLPLFAQAICT